MDPLKAVKPLMLVSATAALLLAPTARAGGSPMGSGEACADGSCCTQAGAICNHAGHEHNGYYFQSSGSCGS
jgi:hypothetical protein